MRDDVTLILTHLDSLRADSPDRYSASVFFSTTPSHLYLHAAPQVRGHAAAGGSRGDEITARPRVPKALAVLGGTSVAQLGRAVDEHDSSCVWAHCS